MTAEVAARGSAMAFVTRRQLFFALFLLASLNAFFGNAVGSVTARGWASAAANLFDVSAILWVALAAGLNILAEAQDRDPWRRGDAVIAAGVLVAALLPASVASALALTAAALWAIVTSSRNTALRRSGIIFLTITGAILWGRLLLTYFSRPLLDIDALFVTSLVGGEQIGNVIWSDATGARVIVAAGCSSMRGLSLALVFWATINQFYRVRFGWRAALTCLAALGATIAVNVMRIGAMLRWPRHLEEIHLGWGWLIAMWANLLLIAVICLWGARREIFDRR
jgi:hypothetical protein